MTARRRRWTLRSTGTLWGASATSHHTQPDLAFSIGYVSRFMQRPTTEHQQAVKRIIRYVAGTLDHGLHYPRCPGAAHFVGYSDSDHASDIDTSKSTSTSGILFFLGKCLVSW